MKAEIGDLFLKINVVLNSILVILFGYSYYLSRKQTKIQKEISEDISCLFDEHENLHERVELLEKEVTDSKNQCNKSDN